MRLRGLLVVACVIGGTLVGGGPARAVTCAEPSATGDWPSYGHDLANTRNQPAETGIGPATVLDLGVEWAFSAASAGGGSGALGFQSTPVIADGCLYAASSGGTVYALNADAGDLIWRSEELGGGIFAVSVADGRVYANVSAEDGPTAVALDQATGDELWRTVLDTEPTAYTNASVVAFDGILFLGISGGEDGPGAEGPHPGGFALLDAATGELLKRTYTIPPDEQERGYFGASIWATAVVEDGFAYVGTGQPAAKSMEHELANAVLKIDVDRESPTFGEIVDAYKGNVDSYVPGLGNHPACKGQPEEIGGGIGGTCFALDIDFGGSSTLITDSRGNRIVGTLQKSGVFHGVYTDTMQEAFRTIVSAPAALANAGSAANDGDAIYVKATPGLLYSIEPDFGGINWVAPVADAVDYQPVSVANGVVYLTSSHGFLMAYDAATGVPLAARLLSADTGDGCAPLAGGVSIARGKVYVTCDIGASGGGWIVAYG